VIHLNNDVRNWRYNPKSGDSLTFDQYKIIMNEIWEHHRFGGLSKSEKEVCRHIKYAHPLWDMRDGKCFSITFRGLFGTGTILFDRSQSNRSMFDRIMEWLNGNDDVEAYHFKTR
jgi:hypothetical protein